MQFRMVAVHMAPTPRLLRRALARHSGVPWLNLMKSGEPCSSGSSEDEMGRPHHERKRFEVAGQARFLTFSCLRRLALLGNARIRDAFVQQLMLVRGKGAFELHAWVVMPEHVHLLITPALPDWTVGRVLRVLKGPFSAEVLARWREVDAPILKKIATDSGRVHFWQRGGGYDRNIYTRDEFLEKVAYIHSNPIRRGLVRHEKEWRWSSAHSDMAHPSG